MLATPYMSYLVQYPGIGLAQIVAAHDGPASIGKIGPDPRQYLPTVRLISDQDITDALAADIDATPRPAGEETLYMAVISSQAQPVLSGHTSAGGFHYFFRHGGHDYDFGAVLNLSGNTADNIWGGGGLVAAFTHELVEACTDPDGSSGYRLTPPRILRIRGRTNCATMRRRPRCGCPGSAGTWVSRAIGRISTTSGWCRPITRSERLWDSSSRNPSTISGRPWAPPASVRPCVPGAYEPIQTAVSAAAVRPPAARGGCAGSSTAAGGRSRTAAAPRRGCPPPGGR